MNCWCGTWSNFHSCWVQCEELRIIAETLYSSNSICSQLRDDYYAEDVNLRDFAPRYALAEARSPVWMCAKWGLIMITMHVYIRTLYKACLLGLNIASVYLNQFVAADWLSSSTISTGLFNRSRNLLGGGYQWERLITTSKSCMHLQKILCIA